MNNNEHDQESNIVPTDQANLALFNSSLVTRGLDLANEMTKKDNEFDLKEFQFETVTVNRKGKIIKREIKQASYFTQDLGNGVMLDMVKIPGGRFLMGTEYQEVERLKNKYYNTKRYDREKPQHQVTIPSFFIGKYTVTQAQWRAIASSKDLKVEHDIKTEPSRFKENMHPVERVSWYDAIEFCQRLSKLTNQKYQLPSESQWEYACRAVNSEEFTVKEWNEKYHQPFYFGETITTDLANYNGIFSSGRFRQKTTPVGIFPPNAFGLYDMHGNVWEWCEDDWHTDYKDAPTNNMAWLSKDSIYKTLRGGSWVNNPKACRSAYRARGQRNITINALGFRVVCVLHKTC